DAYPWPRAEVLFGLPCPVNRHPCAVIAVDDFSTDGASATVQSCALTTQFRIESVHSRDLSETPAQGILASNGPSEKLLSSWMMGSWSSKIGSERWSAAPAEDSIPSFSVP